MIQYSAIKDLSLTELLETIENVWCCLDSDSKNLYIKMLREIREFTKETFSGNQQ